MKNLTIICASVLVASAFGLCGCGSPQKQANKDFFTSGSHEADQRASQRMAQSKQLKGDTSSGGPLAALTTPEDKPHTLYERLGGDSGIQSITDDFVARVMSDPRVNWRRYDVKEGGFFNFHRNRTVEWKGGEDAVKLMKKHISQFLSLATGGPSTYEGKEMHQGARGAANLQSRVRRKRRRLEGNARQAATAGEGAEGAAGNRRVHPPGDCRGPIAALLLCRPFTSCK